MLFGIAGAQYTIPLIYAICATKYKTLIATKVVDKSIFEIEDVIGGI